MSGVAFAHTLKASIYHADYFHYPGKCNQKGAFWYSQHAPQNNKVTQPGSHGALFDLDIGSLSIKAAEFAK
jgi:hypothetical protein